MREKLYVRPGVPFFRGTMGERQRRTACLQVNETVTLQLQLMRLITLS